MAVAIVKYVSPCSSIYLFKVYPSSPSFITLETRISPFSQQWKLRKGEINWQWRAATSLHQQLQQQHLIVIRVLKGTAALSLVSCRCCWVGVAQEFSNIFHYLMQVFSFSFIFFHSQEGNTLVHSLPILSLFLSMPWGAFLIYLRYLFLGALCFRFWQRQTAAVVLFAFCDKNKCACINLPVCKLPPATA